LLLNTFPEKRFRIYGKWKNMEERIGAEMCQGKTKDVLPQS
jgi:hypothetical protein